MLTVDRARPTQAPCSLVLLLAITVLMGADSCPLTTDPPAPSTGGSPAALDIGGPSGAMWNVGFDSQVRVTLRSGTASESVTTSLTQGAVDVAGRTLDLTSFCWRTDVVCPQQVLASQTAIVQSSTSNQFVVGYNRKGPLTAVTERGLLGTLDGSELSVPLAMSPSKADPCTLGQGSAIAATASAPAGENRAESLGGMVTLRYAGECVTLGGNGALYDTDVVELSVKFAGTRLD